MRRLAFILALLPLTIGAIVLWNQGGSSRASRSDSGAACAVGCTSVGTGARPGAAMPCRPAITPEVPRKTALTEAEPQSAADAFDDSDPMVARRAPHVADYGPGLARGGGRVEFQIRDAKGAELEGGGAPAVVQLWRKLGTFGHDETARYDSESRMLVCAGAGDAGLEPGDYELRASFGVYGNVYHEFSVGPGETRREELRTPNWRRIVTLNFVDSNDRPVPFLVSPPRVNTEPPKFEHESRLEPSRVLRDPPRPAQGGGGGSGGFSYRRSRNRAWSGVRFPTDNGRWYVRVFAGCSNGISVSLGLDMFGVESWSETSDCTEEPWDHYTVRLPLTPEYDDLMQQRQLTREDNPGNRALLTDPVNRQPAPPADPFDEATLDENMWRLVITVAAPVPLTPILTQRFNLNDGPAEGDSAPRPQSLRYSPQHNVWWLDMATCYDAEVRFEGAGILLPAAGSVERIAPGPQRVQRQHRSLECVQLLVSPPSPTVHAFGHHCVCALGGVSPLAGTALPQSDGTRKVWIPKHLALALEAGTRGEVQFFESELRTRISHTCTITLSAKNVQELALGGTSVQAEARGLALRAIGPAGEGLPWVEASLVTEEEDIASKRARLVWLASRAANDRAMEDCYLRLGEEPDPGDELLALLGRFKDESARAFMKKNGAWYSTFRKLQSDRCGYMAGRFELEPGKRYVLYLWSNSRDELLPDRRIDFVATEGVADLGVIVLPGYGG